LQSDTWELLFHSNKHGQSFNTFMGKVGEFRSLFCIFPVTAGSKMTANMCSAAAAALALKKANSPSHMAAL